MNGELPKGWVWTSLENIADIVLGQSPPSSTYNEDKIGLPFYQGKSEFGLIYPTPTKWCFSPKKIAESGDVLISVRAPVGPTNICPEKSCIGRGLAAIRGLENINNKFILYLLRNFEEQLRNKATGTTFEAITGNVLRDFEVPLPPLQEQQRIVNKIEELFTNLDKGIESLNEVKYKLKIYRQAILKYAMEGKLTEKWREENNYPSIPIQLNLNSSDYYFSNEVPTTNIHSSWKLVKVEEVADFFKGQRSPKKYYVDKNHPDAKPYIRIQDFKTKEVSMYTRADWCLQCKKTDTLLATDGAIGSSNFGWDGVLTHHILCIRPKQEFIHPYYLFLFISLNKNFFYKNKTGVCSPTLRQQYVRNLAIPISPLEEQNIIVERIEQLFSLADYIEETVESKLEQSKTLRQSILKKAFEGKLVPQDPNDEPAEILLEKIKKQRLNKEKLVQEKLI
ncbi:MAG TPA: hypothetical protein HA367_03705 [Candidatus Methanofastidiosum sp.]|nr:hypothetical protein [Methanofastidiosum sp.]